MYMADDDRKARATAILGKLKGASSEESPDYGVDSEMAAEEVLSAIESKDAMRLAEAGGSRCRRHRVRGEPPQGPAEGRSGERRDSRVLKKAP